MARVADIARHRGWAVLGLIAWIGLIAVGLSRAETNIEDFFPWLPDDTPARHVYMDFIQRFGADDVLIMSWEGCRLDDPRVDELSQALLTSLPDRVRDVTTAQKLITELTGPPQNLPREDVIQRITNVLVGPDGESTCLFVHLSGAGMRDRRGTVERIVSQARETCGLTSRELRLGGHPYVGYFSAEQTRKSILWLSVPVAAISTLLAWFCLRRARLMLLVLACGGMAALSALAMVPLAGYRVNGLLSALPSLVFVITTSGVIHVVNYSLTIRREDREAGRTTTPAEHAATVRRRAGVACLLSSVSNLIGTMSLVWSGFPAIREFGIFGSVAAFMTLGIHLGLLPSMLAWGFPDETGSQHVDPFEKPFARLFEWMLAWRRQIVLGALVSVALLVWPLFRLEGRFTLDRMFRPQSEFVQNINWLEAHIGPIDATEVLVRFDDVRKSGFFRRIRQIQTLEAALAESPGVASTFSTVTLLPRLPDNAGVTDLIIMRHLLEKHRGRLLGGSHLVQDDDAEVWRITLRSKLFGGISREELMHGVRERVTSTLSLWEEAPQVSYTGGSEIFHETQHDVLYDFARSLVLAYAQIFVMMVLALRNLTAAILSMLPNVFPCLTVFGLLGWIDRGIDIGMTVAGCIALGVAVDNTAHLLLFYRESLPRRGYRKGALRATYRHSATAVFQTSLICGLSMLPYTLSEMLYLSRFGLLMTALMFAANFCDLLLTPALVASRIGHCFDGGWKPGETAAVDSPPS